MTNTPLISAQVISTSGDFINPVKLALQAGTTSVQLTAQIQQNSNPDGMGRYRLRYISIPVDLVISSAVAMQLATASQYIECPIRVIGDVRYFQTPRIPNGGGYLYAWLEVPAAVNTTFTVTASEL